MTTTIVINHMKKKGGDVWEQVILGEPPLKVRKGINLKKTWGNCLFFRGCSLCKAIPRTQDFCWWWCWGGAGGCGGR